MHSGFLLQLFKQSFGGLDAVDGGGHNAAGVARTLTAGIDAPHRRLTATVTREAYGGRRTALHTGEHRVGTVKAAQLTTKDGQGIS